MGWIYVIRGPLNGHSKAYIGQTTNKNPNVRWTQHYQSAQYFIKHGKSRNGGNSCLYRSMKKYGLSLFCMIPLLECDNKDLNAREIEFIVKYKSISPRGYNLMSGGGSGGTHHDDTKKLISQRTSEGIDNHLDSYRKYSESEGLPKYINYYVRKDRQTHGYNIFYSKGGNKGTCKRVFVSLSQPLTEEMKQKAIQIRNKMIDDFERNPIREHGTGSETKC